jgi:Domain of unknown function (DUF1854)
MYTVPGFEENWIMKTLKIKRMRDGQLLAQQGSEEPVAVHAVQCFPWTDPDRYITLRDDKDKEVALIKDLHELDYSSRVAVLQGLSESAFVLEVESVEAIDTEFEIRNWKVKTRQGAMKFQTKLDEWPRETPGGGMLMRDVSGNLFHFKEPHKMDEKSRKLLWGFLG